jgi:nitrogen fixation/metabolism regulation signal transduction histidine kinase
VETEQLKRPRRKTPWVVGTLMVASLALLVILQSTNLWKTFTIESSADLLLLYALSSLNFIAFVIFAFVFLRSIVKLVRERRTFELGAQIKTRLLIYFFAVSLLPIIAMAVFSYLFMNRALERWFTQIPETVINEAKRTQQTSLDERARRLDETAKMLAGGLEDRAIDNATLDRIAAAGHLSYIEVISPQNQTVAISRHPLSPDKDSEMEAMLGTVRRGGRPGADASDGRGFDLAVAQMSGGRRLLVVPEPFGETSVSQIVDNSVNQFQLLGEQQFNIRRVGLLTLGVLAFLLIFASSWIAFYVARGLTTPIKALAEGAGEIAKGNLSHRVDVFAEDELAILVNAFNDMSAGLEANSAELGERRRYIETVLETLPTGVISFDPDERVSTINDAAAKIFEVKENAVLGILLNELPIGDSSVVLRRLVSRARRTGHASEQTALRIGSNGNDNSEIERTVAMTASALPAGSGVVVVIEDLSELIAAQRATAWQEVARRMAHEIKNPLTPIQLSAERIAKRFTVSGHQDNGTGKRIDDRGPISNVVHESTATILREVSTLKWMVDEFSRFARLPSAKLETGDLNNVVEQALAVFEGRFQGVSIEVAAGTELPKTLLDGEQLKRVFVNLVENSVEAFDEGQPDRRIVIATRYDPARDLLIAEVSDNGKGISPGDLQKLFQPYFSTKGRGTGLGLAIVNRIISEHKGRIHAVANQPRGAKFIIELPVNS